MIKTKTWICVILSAFLLSAVLTFLLPRLSHSGTIANIYADGTCIRSVDLAAVKEAEQFVLTGAAGSNTVLVEPGRICIAEADCPDQICVASGWLEHGGAPVVCLPHRLVIQIEDSSADASSNKIDAISK